MSRNYLAERIEKKHALNTHLGGHHKTYADRVERIVCDVFDVKPIQLRIRCRARPYARARQILFHILYQPGKTGGWENRRTQSWLAKRYNVDPWSVQHGLKRVAEDPDLQRKAITVMALLEKQLELELFGPRRGDEDAAREEPRGCNPLL